MGLLACRLAGRVPGSRPGAALEHFTIFIPQQIRHDTLPGSPIHPVAWFRVKPAGATPLVCNLQSAGKMTRCSTEQCSQAMYGSLVQITTYAILLYKLPELNVLIAFHC